MQRACAVLSPVACPALQYFSTLSHNGTIFGEEKVIEHKLYVYSFFLQLMSEEFFILRRTERNVVKNVEVLISP
jgi:hypothetical protein